MTSSVSCANRESTVQEGCVPTAPIFTHALDCEDEELEECQRSHYTKREEEFAELLSLVKIHQTLSADSQRPTSAPSPTSGSTVTNPAIKPVDINVLLQPGVKTVNNAQTIVVSSSPSTSTTPSARVWLDHGGVNVANGSQVRLQLVSSSSLVTPSQIRIAAPSVRIAVPSNGSYCPAPSTYRAQQIAQQTTGISQPVLARPASYQAMDAVVTQQPSPSVRAVHSLPQQLSTPFIQQTASNKSTITTPWAKHGYSSGKLAHSGSKPETQPKTLSNQGAITATTVASPSSQLQKALMTPSNQWVGMSAILPKGPEERRPFVKPVITYGPASSQNAALAVQLPVLARAGPQSPSISAAPPSTLSSTPTTKPGAPPPRKLRETPPSKPGAPRPSTPTELNAGKSLPLLPCSMPEQNQDKRVPANGIDRPSDLVDLTAEDGLNSKSNNSRNASKGVDGKIFPSLVVVARPSLSKFPASTVAAERQIFDAEIRKMLACPVRLFIKRLFRLGLLLSSQQCGHGNPMVFREPPLWVSKCCRDRSVFANSLFEGSSLSPVVVIKLLYHWACNTNVQNVMFWVNVESVIVRTYYTNFRAVCSAAVQEKIELLGGSGKAVQIGVISLGTTTEENGAKEVKLDILAALEEDKKRIRLKALDNSEIRKSWDDAAVYKYKFRRIAENLKAWVDPDSIIILDFVVDHQIFRDQGFQIVVMSDSDTLFNNSAIMSYLRRSIPQMFQNTLSLLSINIIQQFLDELTWREIWGTIPQLAYENLVEHIAEMMKLPGPPIIEKLNLITLNPSADWRYSVWAKWKVDAKSKSTESPAPKPIIEKGDTSAPASHKRAGPRNRKLRSAPKISEPKEPDEGNNEKSVALSEPIVPDTPSQQPLVQKDAKNTRTASNRQISLELYYYGFIGSPVLDRRSSWSTVLCIFCSNVLSTVGLTNHLIAHALDPAFTWRLINTMKVICRYCFDTFSDLDAHMAEAHPLPRITPTTCRICTIDFKENESLINHMAQTHHKLDMPYLCEICGFRTSIYEEILRHFALSHVNDPCAVCPYCLKVVKMADSSDPVSRLVGVQNYFVQHIQKHRIESLNKKCEKCILSFVNHDCLKKHQETRHDSCENMQKMTRYKISPFTVVMMYRPSAPPLPPITSTESNFHTLQGKTLPLPQFTVDSDILSLNCLECDGPISEAHYTLKLKCTKCNFTSHCANAIREHSTRAHAASLAVAQRIGGVPERRTYYLCSLCDFKSNDGNRVAEHLEECGSYATAVDGKSLLSDPAPKKRRRT